MNLNSDMRQQSQNIMDQKQLFFQRTTKVRFPKGCVFLAACSSGDIDEVRAHLKLGVNINTTNIDGLTALHQVTLLLFSFYSFLELVFNFDYLI